MNLGLDPVLVLAYIKSHREKGTSYGLHNASNPGSSLPRRRYRWRCPRLGRDLLGVQLMSPERCTLSGFMGDFPATVTESPDAGRLNVKSDCGCISIRVTVGTWNLKREGAGDSLPVVFYS